MRELKAEKIREMTEDEIVTRVRELHEEIFNLRFRNAMRQLQNPLLIRERKRDIGKSGRCGRSLKPERPRNPSGRARRRRSPRKPRNGPPRSPRSDT